MASHFDRSNRPLYPQRIVEERPPPRVVSQYVDIERDYEERKKREMLEREALNLESRRRAPRTPSPPPAPPAARPWPIPPNHVDDRRYIQRFDPASQSIRPHETRPPRTGPPESPPVIIRNIYGDAYDSDGERGDTRYRDDDLDIRVRHPNSSTNQALGLFQTVYDVASSKDVTVHLDFPVFHDYDTEVEDFSRFRRLGNFEAAKDLFQKTFEDGLKNPYMFVQYAEMLLEMGDYKSFALLDPRPAFGDLSTLKREHRERERERGRRGTLYDIYSHPQATHWLTPAYPEVSRSSRRRGHGTIATHRRSRSFERPSTHTVATPRIRRGGNADETRHHIPPRSPSSSPSPPPRGGSRPEPTRINVPRTSRVTYDASVSSVLDETQLLALNWRLMRTLVIIHRDGVVNDALDEAHFALRNLVISPTAGSTEVQIMSLTLRIFGYVRLVLPNIYEGEIRGVLDLWTEWRQLYSQLLSQGRIWDFRDVFSAAISAFGLKEASHHFFGHETVRDKIVNNWKTHAEDESTILAQLDMLVGIILDSQPPEADLNERELAQLKEDAQSLAESIMKSHPETMKTRPFMRWLMAKSTESSFKGEGDVNNLSGAASRKQFDYLQNYLGFSFFPPGWISLPIYVPLDWEIPNWHVPKLPDEVNEPVRTILALATQLHDYTTQALCLKLLILTSQEPAELFSQLGQLQKSVQEDMAEYLSTCLSKFQICRDKVSQSQLLAELKEMDDWTQSWILRDAHAYFGKQYIERALSAKVKGRKFLPPLDTSNMQYYPWLSSTASRFVGIDPRIDPHNVPSHYPSVPSHYPSTSRDVDGDELDRVIRERDVPRKPPRAQERVEAIAHEKRGKHSRPPRAIDVHGDANGIEKVDQVTTEAVRESIYGLPAPPLQYASSKPARAARMPTTRLNRDPSSESSSDYYSDPEDFRQIFGHINKGVMRKELLAGKRITVSIQDSEKDGEHGSVSWVKDGEWIYTTKKERVAGSGAETSEHARRQRARRRARRRAADENSTESSNDSDTGARNARRESAPSEPENLQMALIRHPNPTNDGIRIVP